VQLSVTGSGHITTNAKRTFSFTARQNVNGTVKGQFNLVIHSEPQVEIHAEVICLSVAGNRAWVGGVVKSASNSAWLGLETGWAVEDNGSGSPSPDFISLMNVPSALSGLAQSVCDNQTRVPNSAVEGGNVTIH
jgi:hypothetical protein